MKETKFRRILVNSAIRLYMLVIAPFLWIERLIVGEEEVDL